MQKRRLNIIRRVAWWGVVGAVVNVGVAWGVALLPPPDVGGGCDVGEEVVAMAPGWPGDVPEDWPRTFFETAAAGQDAADSEAFLDGRVSGAAVGRTTVHMSAHWRFGIQPRRPARHPEWSYKQMSDVSFSFDRCETGWPMRSMIGESVRREGGPDGGEVVRHTQWALPDPKEYRGPAVIPLRPLWPGFVVDTVLYGAAVVILGRLPMWLVRARRRRRGLCGACAYPVGVSSVCTECGARLKLAGRRGSGTTITQKEGA